MIANLWQNNHKLKQRTHVEAQPAPGLTVAKYLPGLTVAKYLPRSVCMGGGEGVLLKEVSVFFPLRATPPPLPQESSKEGSVFFPLRANPHPPPPLSTTTHLENVSNVKMVVYLWRNNRHLTQRRQVEAQPTSGLTAAKYLPKCVGGWGYP